MSQLDFSQPPFDVLTLAERQTLKKHSQIRYLEKDESLSQTDGDYLFIVLKGHIQHSQSQQNSSLQNNNPHDSTESSNNFVTDFSKDDWFQPQMISTESNAKDAPNSTSPTNSTDSTSNHYIATEQTLLLQVEYATIERISAQNHLIRQLLHGGIAEKVKAHTRHHKGNHKLGKQQQGEAQQLMLQPVTAIPLLPVHLIDENDSIFTASQTMVQAGTKHVLVHRHTSNERHPTKANQSDVGILTDSDICRAVSEGKDPTSTASADYASFKLRSIYHHNDISDALLVMMRHRVHRLPVIDDEGQIIGILGQTDLLSFISHHSQLITVQIEQASDVESLHKAVDMIGKYIRTQQQNGIKVGVISRMVQTLNAQVFAKLWQLIVPTIVYENTCVIVMGSEGRGEQIMRTDQDNALIIRNGFKDPQLADYAEQFNQSLAQMGYPLCDGDIMMNNPMWRQSLNRFERQISTWFSLKDPLYAVYLSAILDGAYVCGDERLLTSLRTHLQIAHRNSDPMMIRQFARIALQYGEVNQWWQRFSPFRAKDKKDGTHANDIDLKKAGIFPIVHGVRAMAMEHDIYQVTSTKARLKALARAGVISEKRAETLTETLHFFMVKRLAVALSTDDKLARQVNPTSLSALERDLMKECLNVVKSFKNELTGHYQLNFA